MTDPNVCVPSASGTMPAATAAAARRVIAIPGVGRSARLTPGELGGDRFTEDRGTGFAQTRDHPCVLVGPAPFIGLRPVRGGHIGCVDQVFDADRDARERRVGSGTIDYRRRRQMDERLQLRLQSLRRIKCLLHSLIDGARSRADRVADFADGGGGGRMAHFAASA
jgi:hypothetical protein